MSRHREPHARVGKWVASYQPAGSVWIGLAAGSAILFVGATLLMSAWRTRPVDEVLGVIGCATFIIGTWMLWHGWNIWRQAVYLYEHGVIFVKGSAESAIPWAAIRALKQDRSLIAHGMIVGRRDRYTVVSQSGETFTFSNHLSRSTELATEIGKAIHPILIASALADLQRGKTCAFGAVEISPRGLAVKKDFLSWAEIEKIDLTSGTLRIAKRGRFLAWKLVPVPKIDNLSVLLASVDYLSRRKS